MTNDKKSKTALELAGKTIGKTPWLIGLFVGVPLATLCALTIIYAAQGTLTLEKTVELAGMAASAIAAAVVRIYLERRKQKQISASTEAGETSQ